MSSLDRAFADWYRSDRDNIWSEEDGGPVDWDFANEDPDEYFADGGDFDPEDTSEEVDESIIELIIAGTLVSDDAVDMDTWRALHNECE